MFWYFVFGDMDLMCVMLINAVNLRLAQDPE
jgi:hypothetical protein